MKISLTDNILQFTQEAESPSVSIYYPTHRTGPETRQDPIRMKNLLRQANDKIADFGSKNEEILRPAWDLIPDIDFWTHQQEGLAILASPGQFRYFHLPFAVPEMAVVSHGYHLKPLLPLFSSDDHFFILALSKNHVQLYEANRYSLRQVQVPGLPVDMAESLQFDEGEQQLQQHTSGPKGQAGNTIFHGQGGEKDIRNDELLRFFRTVDRGLHDHLKESNLPLILAGVDYYLSIYQEANTYPFLLPQIISGGLESMPEKELHRKAWALAEPHINQAQKRMLDRFERTAYTNGNGSKNTVRKIEPAVVAAFEGRIDALVLPREQEVWGEFDESTEQVRRQATAPSRSRELLDFAAMQTLLHGGEVFLIPKATMPPDAEVAALLRYAGGVIEAAS